MILEWSELAEADLDALVWYIAADSVSIALEVDRRILEAVEQLVEAPEIGRVGRFPGTREWVIPHDRCVVVYRLENEVVQILRLIHGGQEWPAEI